MILKRLQEVRPEVAMFFLSVITTLVGIWLLLPMRTFDDPRYAAMVEFGGEGLWGSLFVLTGIGLLLTWRRRNYEAYTHVMTVALLLWLFVGIGIGLYDWRAIATVTYPGYALLISFVYVSLSGQRRRTEIERQLREETRKEDAKRYGDDSIDTNIGG